MAQHEKCFAGSVLQGSCILDWLAAGQLCILRESNLNHPTLCSALGRLRCYHCSACAAPVVSNLKPLPRLTDSPLGIAQVTSFAIGPKKKPWPLLAPLLERQKFKNFRQILGKMLLWTESCKMWSVLHCLGLWVAELPSSAAILRQLCTRRFLSRKVHVWAQKIQNMRILAENLA